MLRNRGRTRGGRSWLGLGAGSAAIDSPTDLFPGSVWFDPASGMFSDAGVTPVADGQAVAQADSGGAAASLAPPSAGTRPTWHANSGKPYLTFDGTDDQFGGITLAAGPLLYWCAVRYTGGFYPYLLEGAAFTAPAVRADGDPGANLLAINPSGNLDSGIDSGDNAWHTLIYWLAAGGQRLWVDGVLLGTAGAGTAYAGAEVTLFARADDSTTWNGDAGPFGFQPNADEPAAAAVAALHAYLAGRVS